MQTNKQKKPHTHTRHTHLSAAARVGVVCNQAVSPEWQGN